MYSNGACAFVGGNGNVYNLVVLYPSCDDEVITPSRDSYHVLTHARTRELSSMLNFVLPNFRTVWIRGRWHKSPTIIGLDDI